MKTLKTNFKGLEIFESKNIFDNRGYFREVFIKKKYSNDLIFTVGCACKIASNNGITCSFVSESNFLETFSMIICFCEIGSVDIFSINVNCII